jgi:hypothetical protein
VVVAQNITREIGFTRLMATPDGAVILVWTEYATPDGNLARVRSVIWQRGRWSRPISLGAQTDIGCDPQIEADSRGNVLAGWCAAAGVRTVSRHKGGSWGRPSYVRAVREPGSTDLATSRVSIALPPAGRGGALLAFSARDTIQVAERGGGGGWSPPAVVEDATADADVVHVGGPKVAFDPDGTAYLVSSGQVSAPGLPYVLIVRRRPPGEPWSERRQRGPALLLTLARDPSGRALVIWQTWLSSPVEAGEKLHAQRLADPLSGSTQLVGPPEGQVASYGGVVGELSDGRGGRSIVSTYGAEDPAKTIAVTDVAADGTWAPPTSLWAPAERITGISLAEDAAGRAIIAWSWYVAHTDELDQVWASVRAPGGAWSTPQQIAGAGTDPMAAFLPNGRASITWTGLSRSAAPRAVLESSVLVR